MDSSKEINLYLLAVLLFLPPILFYSFAFPHADVLSIFVTIIGLWLTEAVPLPVTGMLVPVLGVLYGSLPATMAFNAFGSDILFLFLGCFLMGRSMEKHSFDKRIAYFLLGRCMPGTSLLAINIVIAFTCFILSMWISNTSTTAIISAVTVGILSSIECEIPDPKMRQRVTVRLLLTCAFASSIGGLATPIGSPPNLIAIKFLSQNNIEVSFIDWLIIGLPISLCMLALMFIIFEILFPFKRFSLPSIKQQFQNLLVGLGPMQRGEKQIALIFITTIIFWIMPNILHSFFPKIEWINILNSRLSISVVGLIGGLITFFLPVGDGKFKEANLTWSETDRVEWGTLMLFGGGLTLGLLLEASGTAKDLGNLIFSSELNSPVLLGTLVVLLSIIISEFASNTAAASILIPLILGATLSHGSDPILITNLVLATTFAASFGFMLPVSTPPNAIVYGTGRVPAQDMRRAGAIFDIAGAAIIISFMILFR